MATLRFPSPMVKAVVVLLTLVIQLITADELPNLRVLPLGDSITKGNGESQNNGYRQRLRDKLVSYADGHVDMIGSLRTGRMFDNDHQGHSGETLSQILGHIKRSIPAKPNVVLVHAGTNNMDLNVDVDIADTLMESIIDDLFGGSPNAAVLVAPIIWANKPEMQARTDVFNQKLAGIIERRQRAGQRVLSVPIDITEADLADLKHPNDSGYQKMADAWFKAIQEANRRGWVKSPAEVDRDELPGMGLGYGETNEGGEVGNCGPDSWKAEGPIFGQLRVWEEVGEVMHPVEDGRRDKVILADLNNDGIDDYILADDDGTVRAWINQGEPNQWTSLGKVNPDWSSITGDMIRLADVDNDGRADLIALYSDGAAKVWKNVDDGREFESLDSEWATGLESRDKIHFQDMDGDGYADYVIVYDGGAVKWARNTQNNGQDDDEWNWEEAVEIAPGPAGIPANRTYLYDLDRDGMSDYVIVYDGGAVRGLRNTGNLNGERAGARNWDDLGTLVPGVEGVTGEMIRFADMDGDGLADLVVVAEDGSMRMWKNLGLIGTRKGLSIRFARLNKDKKVDIVSVDGQGRARAWLNEDLGEWKDIGEIAPGFDDDLSSAEIDFADVDGDGLDDFLLVYDDGSVWAYLNNGNLPDKSRRIWQEGIEISSGVGDPGRKIRFADVNGDGYADYCIAYDGGAVDCYLNQKNMPPADDERIWGERLTVAAGVGWPGEKVRFADITGDGKDDYLIQFEGGGADGYNNTGNIPDGGRVRNWFSMGTISTGVDPQGPVRYADIDGDGKDDYLVVWGGGTVVAYINSCDWKLPDPGSGDGGGGGGGGDDGLNYNSTCEDLEREDGGTYSYKLWNEVGTMPYWKYFLTFGEGVTANVIGQFASDWGVQDPECDIRSACHVPSSCSQYKPQKGSARANLIMRSIFNLHEYYNRLRDAIDRTKDAFSTLRDIFQEYYPEQDLEDEALGTLLGTSAQLFGLAAAVSGSNSVSVASELFSALSDTLTDALVNQGTNISHSDELALYAWEYLNGGAEKIDELHNDLLNKGSYQPPKGPKIVLDNLFKDGRWVDTTRIPILNDSNEEGEIITSKELMDYIFDFFHAGILNYSWRNSMVYVVGHPMTQSEFDDGFSEVDDALKAYHNGWGYFLQSIELKPDLGQWVYRMREPPGYKNLTDNKLSLTGFTGEDVIKVSVDTFYEFGYGYTDLPVLDDLINADWDDQRDLKPTVLGTFSLPVCDLSKVTWDTWDESEMLDYLMQAIGGKDARSPSVKDIPLLPIKPPDYGSLITCFCGHLEDDNGQKFRDQLLENYILKKCPSLTELL